MNINILKYTIIKNYINFICIYNEQLNSFFIIFIPSIFTLGFAVVCNYYDSWSFKDIFNLL